MALSPVAADLCTSLSYLNNTYRIINVRPSNISWYSNTTANVTAVSPGSVDIATSVWTRVPVGGLASGDAASATQQQQLKPLLVDCPIQACGFPISGPYGDLQRYFMYVTLVASVGAARSSPLRSIAQLWLLSTGLTSFVHMAAMLSAQEADANKFVDRDFVPATMYACTAVVAVALWTALRHTRAFGPPFRLLALFGVWGHVVGWLVLTILTIFVYLYYEYSGQVASAVLLQSDAAFWLTGVCYLDSNGTTRPWSGAFNYGIRRTSELALLDLPMPSSLKASAFVAASGRAIHPVWLETVAAGLLGLVILTGVLWTALYCYGRLRWGRWGKSNPPKPSPTKPLPIWRKLLPSPTGTSRTNSNSNSTHATDRLLDICQAVPLTAAWAVFVVLLETGIYKHAIARAEPAALFAQWATWVAAAVVVVFVLLAGVAERRLRVRRAREEAAGMYCVPLRERGEGGSVGAGGGGADSAAARITSSAGGNGLNGGAGAGGGLNGAAAIPAGCPGPTPTPNLARPRPVFGQLNLMPTWQFRGASWRY